MKTGVIYKITSPTGQLYIGQTVNLINRLRSYKNLHCKTQRRLYNSFISHGYNNHIIEELETCNRDILNDREVYWISFYDTCNNGMNLSHGGSSYKMSEETKSLISIARIKNQTGIIGRKGKDHYNYGKKASDEVRAKLSASHIGLRSGINNNKFKGFVNAFKDGVFVGRYEGIYDAAKQLNVQHPNISKVLVGKYKQTGGYTFKREAA